jgi:hypothetical protein
MIGVQTLVATRPAVTMPSTRHHSFDATPLCSNPPSRPSSRVNREKMETRIVSSHAIDKELTKMSSSPIVRAPKAIRAFVLPFSSSCQEDKSKLFAHTLQMVAGMPTPPQTPDVVPSKPRGREQEKWITSLCRRHSSIPRTLKKLVRASFATSTTVTTTAMESQELVAHKAGAPLPLAQPQEDKSAFTLVGPKVHESPRVAFDPSRDISLSFLETVPTYHFNRENDTQKGNPATACVVLPTTCVRFSEDPVARHDSPSPSMMRPEVPPRSDTPPYDHATDLAASVRRRRKSRARVVRPGIAYKSILKVPAMTTPDSPPRDLPTPPSRSPMKSFRFDEQVLVGETWPKAEYERKSHTMLQLTPHKAYQIKKELNDFKRDEMAVHEDSRCYTHYFA